MKALKNKGKTEIDKSRKMLHGPFVMRGSGVRVPPGAFLYFCGEPLKMLGKTSVFKGFRHFMSIESGRLLLEQQRQQQKRL